MTNIHQLNKSTKFPLIDKIATLKWHKFTKLKKVIGQHWITSLNAGCYSLYWLNDVTFSFHFQLVKRCWFKVALITYNTKSRVCAFEEMRKKRKINRRKNKDLICLGTVKHAVNATTTTTTTNVNFNALGNILYQSNKIPTTTTPAVSSFYVFHLNLFLFLFFSFFLTVFFLGALSVSLWHLMRFCV